jgi:hypothetical protein
MWAELMWFQEPLQAENSFRLKIGEMRQEKSDPKCKGDLFRGGV